MINYQRMLISTCVWASKDAENVLAAIVQEVIKFMNRLLLIILVDINNRIERILICYKYNLLCCLNTSYDFVQTPAAFNNDLSANEITQMCQRRDEHIFHSTKLQLLMIHFPLNPMIHTPWASIHASC